MFVKVILSLLFPPYGVYLIYKYFFSSKLEKGIDNLEKKYDEIHNPYENNEKIYSEFYEVNLNTTIGEIESELSKGVIIPIHKLYQEVVKNYKKENRDKTQKVLGMIFNQNINDRITSDLILHEDRIIIRTNKNHYRGRVIIDQYGIDEVELFYDKITSILFRSGGGETGRLTSGTMTFVFPGKRDYKKEYSFGNTNRLGIGQSKSNDTDPYLLYFFEELNSLMKEIKDLINKKSRG